MKTCLTLIAVAAAFITSQAQPAIAFQLPVGGSGSDFLNAVAKTQDGGYIAAGATNSNDGHVSGAHGGYDFFIIKMNADNNIQWTKTLGGSADDQAHDVIQTNDGGYVICGQANSNDGNLSGNHGGTSTSDYWVVRLDSMGNIQWQKCYGGSGNDAAYAVAEAGSGYILIGSGGSYDGDQTGFQGGGDMWLVRIDSAGDLQWQKSLGAYGPDAGNSILVLADGKFIAAGSSSNPAVPGYHPDTVFGSASTDAYFVKLDAAGSVLWQKCYGGHLGEEAADITRTADGGYAFAGYSSEASGDVSGFKGLNDYWIAKIDSLGNLKWQYSYGGTQMDRAKGIVPNPSNDSSYYIVGSTSSNDGEVNDNHGQSDVWLMEVDSLIWDQTLGGDGFETGNDVITLDDGTIIIVGETSTNNNGNVFGYKGGLNDGWILKAGAAYDTVRFKVFTDFNYDSIKNPAEPWMKDIFVQVVGGSVWVSGDSGVVIIPLTDTLPKQFVPLNPPRDFTFNIDTSFHWKRYDTSTYLFDYPLYIQPLKDFTDIQVTIVDMGDRIRPGSFPVYSVNVKNKGTDTANVTLTVQIGFNPQILEYLYSGGTDTPTTANTTASGIELTYHFTLPTAHTADIRIGMELHQNAPLGHYIQIDAAAFTDSAEMYVDNNYDSYRQLIVGSFDPNDKNVSRRQIDVDTAAVNPPELAYTIRFQNTGTDTAFKVVLRDTLSDKLNLTTMHVVGASHNYFTRFAEERTIEFVFDNILLPDTHVNEEASHGWLVYRIRPNVALPLGDSVNNAASIYFDFNSPVKTNDAVTYIVDELAVPSFVSSTLFKLYPNPANNQIQYELDESFLPTATFFITDLFGKEVFTFGVHQLSGSEILPPLPSGLYFFNCSSAQKRVTGKLLIHR